MEGLLIEYGGLDFDRWRHDLKEHRKASGGGQRLCTVVLKDVELDGGGRGKRGVVPARRLVARDFTERIACEPEEDVLTADLRLIRTQVFFNMPAYVVRAVYARNSKIPRASFHQPIFLRRTL